MNKPPAFTPFRTILIRCLLLLGGFYWLNSHVELKPQPSPSVATDEYVAHRKQSAALAEHSYQAFSRALAQGCLSEAKDALDQAHQHAIAGHFHLGHRYPELYGQTRELRERSLAHFWRFGQNSELAEKWRKLHLDCPAG